MSELTLTLFRLGLLGLLWVFVFAVVGVLRSDLYGTRVSRRGRRGTRTTTRAPADAVATPRRDRGTKDRGAKDRGAKVRAARAVLPRTLAVTEGGLAGTTLPLGQTAILIGRNPECALVLEDDFASGRHARLYPTPEGWVVQDLGSTNGTFLEGQRLDGARGVRIGSSLRIGRTVLELRG